MPAITAEWTSLFCSLPIFPPLTPKIWLILLTTFRQLKDVIDFEISLNSNSGCDVTANL